MTGSGTAQCTLVLVFLASGAHADKVEDLKTFTAGTPAAANEVNGNFTEVADSVNDNDTRIEELEAELSALQAQLGNLLALNDYLSLQTVHGTATVRITAANLQVVNGVGTTESADGTGNVLIGYDEERGAGPLVCSLGTDANTGRPVTSEEECMAAGGALAIDHKSGSHYLVIGPRHNYSRWGGLVAGDTNTSNYDFASVSGGFENVASGRWSTVSGGQGNDGRGESSSVSGGRFNFALGRGTSVSGGTGNVAFGTHSSVSGGEGNNAGGIASSVTGGGGSTAFGRASSVSGGATNFAAGINSSVSGGISNSAYGDGSSVSGGGLNVAKGVTSSVNGGQSNRADGGSSSVSGGASREAAEVFDWVAGGLLEDD